MFNKCECIYCKQYNDFPVLWELSKDVLWFETPKNGSSTIKNTFKNRRHITDLAQHKNAIPLIVARDPVERFVSLFKHYFLKEGRRFVRSVALCERLGTDVNSMNVDERFDFLLDNLDKLTTAEEVHHFYPQTSFIDQHHFDKFNVIGMENLTETLNVPVSNHTASDVTLNINSEQLQHIKSIYKDDYTFFNKHGYKIQ